MGWLFLYHYQINLYVFKNLSKVILNVKLFISRFNTRRLTMMPKDDKNISNPHGENIVSHTQQAGSNRLL